MHAEPLEKDGIPLQRNVQKAMNTWHDKAIETRWKEEGMEE